VALVQVSLEVKESLLSTKGTAIFEKTTQQPTRESPRSIERLLIGMAQNLLGSIMWVLATFIVALPIAQVRFPVAARVLGGAIALMVAGPLFIVGARFYARGLALIWPKQPK